MPFTARGNAKAIAAHKKKTEEFKKKQAAQNAKAKEQVRRGSGKVDKNTSGKKVTAAQAKEIKKRGKGQRFKVPKGGYQRTQVGRLGRNTHWSE